MTKMRCGVAVVKAMRSAGVTRIFGLMGSSTLEIYDALYDAKDMEYIGVRQENCGMHMADAYARITQTPGVFICGQAGPGAANMVLGLAQAKMAYSPVVAITGLPSTEHIGRDAFQEVDQHTMFQPVTKRVMTVPRAERVPEFVAEAFRIANAGRRGPVVVNIPRDLLNDDIEVDLSATNAKPKIEGFSVDRPVLQRIKEMIFASKSPVIHAGAGIKWARASDKLTLLAEKLSIPVTNSAGHSDVMSTSHMLCAGGVGPRGNPVASALMRDADLIIALGTRLGFNTTFYKYNDISERAKIIQVDIDPIALGRYFPIEVGVVADAGTFVEALLEVLEPVTTDQILWKSRNERFYEDIRQLRQARERTSGVAGRSLHPSVVYSELRKTAPDDSIFTLDAGTTGLQATDQLPCRIAPSLLTPLDCGMVGFSYAAGLGAKVAAPTRTVISLMGDGGFGMTMGEMATAVMHRINTVAIVMDNGCWGSEIAYQRDFYNNRYIGAHVHSPRFDQVMELCGGQGFFVRESGEVGEALKQAIAAGKPAVVHVKVDPDAVISFRKDALRKRS